MTKNGNITERVPIGIKGLDESMEGGFIRNSINLLAGSPGSGKSIFGMQYLFNGITKYDEPGVYITFEERKDKFIQNLKNFDWGLEDLEKKKKLLIVSLSPKEVHKAITKKSFYLKYNAVKKINAKRIVIDSISAYSLLFSNDMEKRKAHINLFEMLRNWGCTTLLLAEYDVEEHKGSPLDFEVDSILWLYNFKQQEVRTRAIEIYKMRGSKHSTKTFPLEIKEKGIVVYPEQEVFKGN